MSSFAGAVLELSGEAGLGMAIGLAGGLLCPSSSIAIGAGGEGGAGGACGACVAGAGPETAAFLG